MCSELAIKVSNVSKYYQVYEKPVDRLKQSIFRGKRKYYTEFKALDDISFEIKKGETVGIIGRNGSGKSTLLQIICGTLTPTNGEVIVNGRVAALLELGAGFNPEFTGRENVYMNAIILGLSKEEIDNKYGEIEKFADIGDYIRQPVKTYSSGMYVRLAFAIIAHVDADILIIDEALSVGDAFFVQKCMRFLRNFMKQGTVLFVSHDTGAVLNLCNSAVLMQNGLLSDTGNPKDITEIYLENLYKSEQGQHSIETHKIDDNADAAENPVRDMRLDFINQTNLRNDIELFEFNQDVASFGKGGVSINNVHFADDKGNTLSWVVGGENVQINVLCVSHEFINNPIVGFQVKDRLGQIVFADNTFLTTLGDSISIEPEESFQVIFEFTMPIMPLGDYTISVAVAEGTQEEHIQHQWVHDALAFKVHSTSVCHGLIGVSMLNIELKKYENK